MSILPALTRPILLTSAILLALSLSPSRATNQPLMDPEGSWAIVDVPAPAYGSLMHLAGLAGRGQVIIHKDGKDTCSTMKARVVAGGFWGLEAQTIKPGPIRLIVRDQTSVYRLARGKELISDEILVTTDVSDTQADVIIASGFPEETGFVVNPGRSFLHGIFGPRLSKTACYSALQDALALAR